MADLDSSAIAYLLGSLDFTGGQFAYLQGSNPATPASLASYLTGVITPNSSTAAYTYGGGGSTSSRRYAYTSGLVRSTLHVSMGGTEMQVNYIILRTDDTPATKECKFRVLAQDYDDGTPEKAETLDRTIGGGLDHSMGAIYTSWSPIIRVRHTESDTGYGTLADLYYFYALNNPNGTPSNNVEFVDHHQVEHIVHLTGTFQKSLLGVNVEGSEGWYLVRVKLVEIP